MATLNETEDIEVARHQAALTRRARWLEQCLERGPRDKPGRHYELAERKALMWVFEMAGIDFQSTFTDAPPVARPERVELETPPLRPDAEVWTPGTRSTLSAPPVTPFFRKANRY